MSDTELERDALEVWGPGLAEMHDELKGCMERLVRRELEPLRRALDARRRNLDAMAYRVGVLESDLRQIEAWTTKRMNTSMAGDQNVHVLRPVDRGGQAS